MTGSYFYNKIIIVLALVAFLVGGFYPVNKVVATAIYTQPGSVANPNSATIVGAGANTTASTDPKTGQTTYSKGGLDQKSDDIYCLDFGGEGLVGARFSMAGCAAKVAFLLLQLAAWVLWLSAIIFNESLKYSLNMAEFIKDIPIVALGWTTLRDVMNLMFVFIILYIGISTIIGNDGYGYKKLLGKVILGAMFINFSLFFTQAMIDVSNIFALQFYNKITQETKAQNSKSGAEANNYDKDSGISAAFVNAMGLQNIWSLGSKTQSSGANETVDINNISESKLGLNANNLIVVGLGGTVLILVTAFVFFAATIMFLVRTVVLIFLMILSPVAFMGSILPALSSVSSDWWKRLMNNLIFAPAYMMLLYIVVSMITSNSFKGVGGKAGNFADMFAGGNNWEGTAITFAVLIMLMLGCLMIASNFGAIGAKAFEKAGFGMAKTLGMGLSGAGIAMGVGRFGMGVGKDIGGGISRGTAGRIGDFVSGNKYLARMSSKPGFGRLAAYTMQQGDKLKDSKIGGKSFNEQVKERQKDYTKRGNLIEDALSDVGPAPDKNAPQAEKDAYNQRKKAAKIFAAEAEGKYLGKSRRSYASKVAIKKAAKAAAGTNNKEALNALLSGKFSPEEHKKATEKIESSARGPSLNSRIAVARHAIKSSTDKDVIAMNSAKLAVLMGEKKEMQDIIDGHLRTVEKLANLDSK
ncbi:MAG: hypothetical protein QG568_746 [Patescibacteria group bacterium]|nr:hypothetical protein [Patescibacteria group bacterium]